MKHTINHPNPEQMARVRAFAEEHGAGWKKTLNSYWFTGRDAAQPDGHLLRQVRNQCGPKWLEQAVI